jgi:hypothetical protein
MAQAVQAELPVPAEYQPVAHEVQALFPTPAP